MNKESIEKIISKPDIKKIIESQEFYFIKGQIALNKWLDIQVSEELKNDLISLSSDYNQFLKNSNTNSKINEIKELLFEIISYCDTNANGKKKYNPQKVD
jgi:5-methylcytosine-specific restriction protein B